MSTLRISNIEAKSVPASATIDEKVKITNSSGDPLVFIDGKTSGITTVGINTTDANITFDANSNVVVTGIITATKFVGTIEPTNLTVGGDLTIPDKIIHTGDTNTAIRFPAADTVTIETAGSERLRIASDGTTTASGTSDGVLQLTTTDSRGAFIRFGQGGSYHNMVGCADGLTSGDKEDLGIRAADNIIFAAGGSTERLRITSEGQVKLTGTNSGNHMSSFGTNVGGLTIDDVGNQHTALQAVSYTHLTLPTILRV